MTEQKTDESSQVENAASSETPAEANPASEPKDPVRKWTFIILGLCFVLTIWYLVSDRITPYTSQAKVHALVVPIAPEVSGIVTSVDVSNSQAVVAGQTLFQIETSRYVLGVETAKANLQTARQATGAETAGVAAAEASLDSARAALLRAEQDAARLRRIRSEDPGAVSQRRVESAEASLSMSQGQVEAAQANVEKARKNLGEEGEENARILQAQVALDQARLDLEHATVRAPELGVVTDVRLDKGNFAAAGKPQMTFIAVHSVWVQAEFTENNLGNIKRGDPVEIIFDVFPGKVFAGTVSDMGYGVKVDSASLGSLPSIENDRDWLRESQRFPVRIEFTRGEEMLGLRVGSQASVMVYTGENWLLNVLGQLSVRLKSILSYAY